MSSEEEDEEGDREEEEGHERDEKGLFSLLYVGVGVFICAGGHLLVWSLVVVGDP